MIYIACDMNCNNFGNYFKVFGLKRELKQDKSSYIVEKEGEGIAYYPKYHCYKAKRIERIPEQSFAGIILNRSFDYSEAINYLLSEDYVRWQQTRFGGLFKCNS